MAAVSNTEPVSRPYLEDTPPIVPYYIAFISLFFLFVKGPTVLQDQICNNGKRGGS